VDLVHREVLVERVGQGRQDDRQIRVRHRVHQVYRGDRLSRKRNRHRQPDQLD
jgi:hypothetical protein